MEIGAYVGRVLHRWWIVVVIALVAAIGTFPAVAGTKDAYTATVDFTVPSVQSGTASSNGIYVENFQVSLTTPSVVSAVAKATGESTANLTAGLAATQLGSSSFIDVTYSAEASARAQAVVVAAAKATSTLLARPAIETATTVQSSAQKAQTDAQARVTMAQSAIDTYSRQYGPRDPNTAYQAAQSSFTQLNVSKQQAIASARPTASFDTAIAAAQAQIDSLAPQVASYNQLTRALSQAQLDVQTSQSRVAAASEQVASLLAAPLIGTPTVERVSRTSAMAKAVGIAAGIGFVVGLALVLLLAIVGGPSGSRDSGTPPTSGGRGARRRGRARNPVGTTRTAGEHVESEPYVAAMKA